MVLLLFYLGILGPPEQLKINVHPHDGTLELSWIAPPSYDILPPPEYVLSNNVSNVPKIINSSCAPSMPCTASIDLSDPLLLMTHNTSILEYNGTIEFTFLAINGAGNGNATTYILNLLKAVTGELLFRLHFQYEICIIIQTRQLHTFYHMTHCCYKRKEDIL